MRVFLGWAGEEANAVALALKEWLPLVCPGLKPWISDDITKGSRWSAAIAQTLRESRAGIFVLTPDNLRSVWLHYEAGAISNVPDALVCTFLRRVDRAAVKEPLDVFQHTTAGDEKDTRQLVAGLEALLTGEERQWSEAQRASAFEMWWPKLVGRLESITPPKDGAEAPKPTTEELLTEVLSTVRGIAARDRDQPTFDAMRDYVSGFVADLPSEQDLLKPSGFRAGLARLIREGMTIKDLMSDPQAQHVVTNPDWTNQTRAFDPQRLKKMAREARAKQKSERAPRRKR